MSDPKPILSYASPTNRAEATGQTTFVFASPAAKPQLEMAALASALCLLGSWVVLGFGFWHHGEVGYAGVMLPACGGAAILVAVAAYRIPELIRLRRFGDEPVDFEVDDGKLKVRAPQQWGKRELEFPLAELKPLKTLNSQTTVAGAAVYFITIQPKKWNRSATLVRIATDDGSALEQTVAELNAAMLHAMTKSG